MGTSPISHYLSNIGFPWYGGPISKDEMASIQLKLKPLIADATRGKELPQYDYILVSGMDTWMYKETVTRGYIFGHPDFSDGTKVEYPIDSGYLFAVPGIYLCQAGDKTILVLGYVQLTNGTHV